MLDDQLRGGTGHGRDGLADGRQLRPDHRCHGRIIESCDGELLGQSQAQTPRHRDGGSGCIVVAGEDGGGRMPSAQHLLRTQQSVGKLEVAGLHQVGIDAHAARLHLVTEATMPLLAGGMARTAEDEADAAVTEVDQVAGHTSRSRVIINTD
jgi:hypothetical protein